MTIQVECEKCGQTYRVSDDKAGRQFRCKKCEALIIVPMAEDEFEDWEILGDVESPVPPPQPARRPSSQRKKGKKKSSRRREPEGFLGWYLEGWKNFNDISGRARRREYWEFVAGNVIIQLLLMGLQAITIGLDEDNQSIFAGIFALVTIFPSISLQIRRLHDIGRSGWWMLINIICLIGPIIMFVFNVTDSEAGSNQWGPNPKR